MPTESRTEQLLNAYINGDDISNFVPLSRNEQILKDMILGNEQISSPQSRIESLYKKLDEKIKEGSGGEDNHLQYVIDKYKSTSCLFYTYIDGGTPYHGVFNNIVNEELFNLLSNVNTINVTDMYGMFFGCSQITTIPKLNTNKVTNMSHMFDGCSNLTTIPQLNTSKVTDTSFMFKRCPQLTEIPQLDTSNVTSMIMMFDGCSNLTKIPQLDTSKVTNMYYIFSGCRNLITIPELNTSNVTSMNGMFSNCYNLTTIPKLNTSKVTNMSGMFRECSKLTTIPQLDTSKVTDISFIFYSCQNLTTIPQLDISKINSTTFMFEYCSKLTYLKLLNVKANLQIGAGTSWGHLIEKDCLIQIISELIKPSSGTKTLTMGTANKAKIADTYVKLLADDGTGKYPFEVCESTDEGAMTIEAYCNSKNWTLA